MRMFEYRHWFKAFIFQPILVFLLRKATKHFSDFKATFLLLVLLCILLFIEVNRKDMD